ncbi:hypothetical protein ACOSP7_023502 [Xanthoceras sorbifolium]
MGIADMEEKVGITLKLIQEDGDSFAKRAEMYKRRTELINFVEESYRAYRALAERYDHISSPLLLFFQTKSSLQWMMMMIARLECKRGLQKCQRRMYRSWRRSRRDELSKQKQKRKRIEDARNKLVSFKDEFVGNETSQKMSDEKVDSEKAEEKSLVQTELQKQSEEQVAVNPSDGLKKQHSVKISEDLVTSSSEKRGEIPCSSRFATAD